MNVRSKWKNNSLLKKKKPATTKITAVTIRYKCAESHGPPATKKQDGGGDSLPKMVTAIAARVYQRQRQHSRESPLLQTMRWREREQRKNNTPTQPPWFQSSLLPQIINNREQRQNKNLTILWPKQVNTAGMLEEASQLLQCWPPSGAGTYGEMVELPGMAQQLRAVAGIHAAGLTSPGVAQQLERKTLWNSPKPWENKRKLPCQMAWHNTAVLSGSSKKLLQNSLWRSFGLQNVASWLRLRDLPHTTP